MTEKKIEANRRNAKKSTGPRTKAGKNRVRMNAVTLAIYADPKNLPGEDHLQTAELVKQVRERLRPEGPLEEAVVNEIISILQKLRRISRAHDVHLTELINEKAVSRERLRLTQLWEGPARRDPSLTKTINIKEAVEDAYAVKHPKA